MRTNYKLAGTIPSARIGGAKNNIFLGEQKHLLSNVEAGRHIL